MTTINAEFATITDAQTAATRAALSPYQVTLTGSTVHVTSDVDAGLLVSWFVTSISSMPRFTIGRPIERIASDEQRQQRQLLARLVEVDCDIAEWSSTVDGQDETSKLAVLLNDACSHTAEAIVVLSQVVR